MLVPWRWILLPLIMTCFVTLHDPGPKAAPGCQWQQTFEDNFDKPQLDRRQWQTEYGSGGNGEQQYYGPDAFTVNRGVLRIAAQQQRHGEYPYTSGIIHTRNTFHQQYGYFTMRAKLPKGQGLWPAFWLLPADNSDRNEIDIFEVLGHEPNVVHLTHHYRNDIGQPRKSKRKFTEADYSKGFHDFGLVWTADELIWYVDYKERFRTRKGLPTAPMYILANLAVGGHWPGNPDSTTPFPSYYEIDHIRVYQEVCDVS